MSHGQASVERGFNIYKTVNKVNISPDSIVTRKLIIDHMQKKNMCPSKMEMPPSLIKSVKASRQRYAFYLKEQKKVQVKSSLDQWRPGCSKAGGAKLNFAALCQIFKLAAQGHRGVFY